MRRCIHARVSIRFIENLNKIYPNEKSIRVKTEKLNNLIEKMIYDKKTK